MNITTATDLTGMAFNNLTVDAVVTRSTQMKTSVWKCTCVCGNTCEVTGSHLKYGQVKSCGCIHGKNRLTHGMSNTAEFKIWQQIRARCYNENSAGFSNYGGRGIVMWESWYNSFKCFYHDMGPRPTKDHSVERIDNDDHYKPSNCHWATRAEQSRNKRSNVRLEYEGNTYILTDLADKLNIKRSTFDYRLRRGKTLEQAIAMGP